MTYEEAIAYLESASSFGIKPGLERIEQLLKALGNPEKSYKTIHITGTNGKGSVSAYISSVLQMSGLKVGRFTSPHLIDYTERMHFGGQDITKEEFANCMANIKSVVDNLLESGLEAPTQFEMLTAAAFYFFQQKKADYVVVEVGMGGLLDSTNVVIPEVSVITNVTIDHQAYCGETVVDIAKHKAGIIKAGVPVVTAAQGDALAVIRRVAKEKKAKLYVFNEDFSIASRSTMKKGQMITLEEKNHSSAMLFTSMLGIHQSVNLACATKALHILMDNESAISEEILREGLACAKWPGRFEVLSYKGRTLVLDGAHNASGAEAFALTYQEVFPGVTKTMVLGILADKEVDAMLPQLIGPADRVITVPAPTPRSMAPEELAMRIKNNVQVAPTIETGLNEAIQMTAAGEIIVVCGSLYVLGDIYKILSQSNGDY